MDFSIPKNRRGYQPWWSIRQEMYSHFIPTREIAIKIFDYVKLHNICNASALHIRSTDMERLIGSKKSGNTQSRINWIESLHDDEKVYFLTDSPEMQKKILETIDKNGKTFGSSKVIVYERILDQQYQKPVSLLTKRAILNPELFSNNSITNHTAIESSLPEEHRFTTLEHTVIDVFIAAHCKYLRGAPYSSLSELVTTFHEVGQYIWGWCKSS